jgi:hypothetical protein
MAEGESFIERLSAEQRQRIEREIAEIEAIELTPEILEKYEGRFDNIAPEHRDLRIKTVEYNERKRQEEADRQRAERERRERDSLERSMGSLATSLTEIFLEPAKGRDPEVVRESVLLALEPLHKRLVRAEWDGVIR